MFAHARADARNHETHVLCTRRKGVEGESGPKVPAVRDSGRTSRQRAKRAQALRGFRSHPSAGLVGDCEPFTIESGQPRCLEGAIVRPPWSRPPSARAVQRAAPRQLSSSRAWRPRRSRGTAWSSACAAVETGVSISFVVTSVARDQVDDSSDVVWNLGRSAASPACGAHVSDVMAVRSSAMC